MRIRWVRSFAEISDELWQASFPPSLEGRWWYAALERCGIGEQFDFHYGIVECDGRAVGIVPAFVMNVPVDLVAPKPIAAVLHAIGRFIPRVQYQRTFFIGSPCSEEGSIGLSSGVSLRDVANEIHLSAIARGREMKAPMLVWKDFTLDDCVGVKASIDDARCFVMPSYPGTRINLPANLSGDFDGYLKSISGSHRHNLKKKLRRAKGALPVEVSIVESIGAVERDELFALFMQTYEKGETKFERLPIRFFEEISAAEPTRFILLRAKDDGKLVAFMLVYILGIRAINKFIGIDYSRASGDAFLYFQLWEAFVNFATSHGARELQSGQTGYRAKLDVGHALVPLFNICRHRNRFMNRVFAFATTGVRWSTLDSDLAAYLVAHPQADQSDVNSTIKN